MTLAAREPSPAGQVARRTRHIGDFTRWKKHGAYQKALERLLRNLKVEVANPPA